MTAEALTWVPSTALPPISPVIVTTLSPPAISCTVPALVALRLSLLLLTSLNETSSVSA